jgi:hypothetical protein
MSEIWKDNTEKGACSTFKIGRAHVW